MEYKHPVFILSYPRSGMNWIRYIIQHIYPKNITEAGNINFLHMHLVEELPSTDLPLVFCLRDYKECIIRNTREYKCVPVIDNSAITFDELISINEQKKVTDPGGTIENYVEILKIYHEWPGKKYLVRYEELISDTASVIAELAWFLEVKPGGFLSNLNFHQNNSISEYNNRHGSYTRGESKVFHQNNMSATDLNKLDDMIELRNPYVYNTYLKQYR